MTPRSRTDLLVALALLALLVAVEFSGADLALARRYADANGFFLRNHWIVRHGLHDGGRVLAGIALAATLVWVFVGDARVMKRRLRAAWFGVILLCLVAVPGLKRITRTSCPWDLAEFGGKVPYVPHWLLGTVDGGPGHCFPSGHAVAAFCFLPLYFQWRSADPRLARLLLAVTLMAGIAFGWAQMARGAHFVTHTLWSAWICWCIGAIAAHWLDRPVVGARA